MQPADVHMMERERPEPRERPELDEPANQKKLKRHPFDLDEEWSGWYTMPELKHFMGDDFEDMVREDRCPVRWTGRGTQFEITDKTIKAYYKKKDKTFKVFYSIWS